MVGLLVNTGLSCLLYDVCAVFVILMYCVFSGRFGLRYLVALGWRFVDCLSVCVSFAWVLLFDASVYLVWLIVLL